MENTTKKISIEINHDRLFKHILTDKEMEWDILKQMHADYFHSKDMNADFDDFSPVYYGFKDINQPNNLIYDLQEGRRFKKLVVLKMNQEELDTLSDYWKNLLYLTTVIH